MKKFIIASFIVLVAAGCSSQKNQPEQLQTYVNGTYGFEFMYPATMQFVTATYPNLADKVVQLQIPQSAYPGTNFGDAAFSVSAQYAKSLQDCLALNAQGSSQSSNFKSTVIINGIDFYAATSTGAAAGNLYQSNLQRTFASGQCIELNQTIHTANIGNYTPGTIQEVDKAAVQSQLDAVLQTFKFRR